MYLSDAIALFLNFSRNIFTIMRLKFLFEEKA